MPVWGGHHQSLTDTAWTCLDYNTQALATMPPYLVDPADSLNADWLHNPEPEVYASWEEFAKRLFWDYQLGEAFVMATAYYSTGYPARFYIVPPWTVEVDWHPDTGLRRFKIAGLDVTEHILHIRYLSAADNARGVGPLEAGAGRLIASEVLSRYVTTLIASGGIPASILSHPEEQNAQQSADLQTQWVMARARGIGMPAVLSGGVTWTPTQLDPTQMALLDLLGWNEARIAIMLGVPPFLVGLPSGGGESMTYSNVSDTFDFHWRMGLRPKASTVMAAMSGWLLPRGTTLELNRDAYIEPEPVVRAQTAQILNSIVDQQGNPALTVDEIRAAERLDNSVPVDVAKGVLK